MSKKAAPKSKSKPAPKPAPNPAPKAAASAAPRPAPASGSRRKIMVAGGVALVCLAFAVPKLIGALHDPEAEPAAPAAPVRAQPAPAPDEPNPQALEDCLKQLPKDSIEAESARDQRLMEQWGWSSGKPRQ